MPDGSPERSLGAYLKDRRSRLDPASFGLAGGRRRVKGLRREEVAQRAGISPTWYTWLEQGRGGAPSSHALDRLAEALMLTEVEREHLFLIGLGRPPEPRRGAEVDGAVTARLQRVLDALEPSAALIRTLTWDVLAWNRAVPVVLGDYARMAPEQRNILRLIFCDPHARERQENWEAVARYVTSAFRADAARAGDDPRIAALVEEVSRQSPEFRAMWQDHEVRNMGGGTKRLHMPGRGIVTFEHSSFGVEGRADLTMLVYTPVDPADAAHVRSLYEAREG